MAGRLSPAEDALLREFMNCLLDGAPAGPILTVRVFGSRACGEAGPASDLDVAVALREGADRAALHRLATDAASDAREARDAHALGLAPVVLLPGPPVGLRGAILRDGLAVWTAPSP